MMRIDEGALFRETVTILNKIDARDARARQDAWHKTVLHDCMWSSTTSRGVDAGGTVALGGAFRVQIPGRSGYVPYREWVRAGDRDSHFTVRPGDYVLRGELVGDVTPANLREVVSRFEPDACQVKVFEDLAGTAGMSIGGAGGLLRFAEALVIEGV